MIKSSPLSAGLLSLLMLFHSCSQEEELPAHVIEDEKGIRIDLEWQTGDSDQAALLDADLDLYAYKNKVPELQSVKERAFESVQIRNHKSDGEFVVRIVLFKNAADKRVDYTLRVTGASRSKKHRVSGYFRADDPDEYAVDRIRITKSAGRYTISPL